MSNQFQDELLVQVTKALSEHQLTIATAESCTGGMIASLLTDLPGSSSWFQCGFVTYSNESKEQLLGIDPVLIETYGAVSAEVAEAMALGALSRSTAGIALAVTGIAGPGGGSRNKPVGTVWLAIATHDVNCLTILLNFPHQSRHSIRKNTVFSALQALLRFIDNRTIHQ